MLKVKIVHNLWTNFEKENLPQVVANSDDYKNIFLIPWGHHKIIIDKCRNDQQKSPLLCQQSYRKQLVEGCAAEFPLVLE